MYISIFWLFHLFVVKLCQLSVVYIIIVKEYKDEFLYLKYTLLKNLRLPYNSNFFRQYDNEAGLSQEDIQEMQCQNCGYYFIPSNLKETKYCNVEYENTGKTCKQIGKELAYKKSLQEDKLLDKYRKRYMSLASSVSHYGTEKAIERFEKYKKDGVIMKKKYLNKDITPKEFEKWIESTKK